MKSWRITHPKNKGWLRKMKLFRLIFLILLLPAALCASAQQLDETASRNHIFPLFVDGDGYRTHLFVTDVSNLPNQCTLVLQGAGLQIGRLQSHAAVTAAGPGATIDLPRGGGSLALVSSGTQSLASGYANLDCLEPIVARLLMTLGSSGSPVAMTALESASTAFSFQFPAIPRFASQSLIVSNNGNAGAVCTVELEDGASASVGRGNFSVPEKSMAMENLADLVSIPDLFESGTVTVSCDREVAAFGLFTSGDVFASLPATVLDGESDLQSAHLFPLVADGGGFRSRLLIANLSTADNRCVLDLQGSGLDMSRFETRTGVSAGSVSATLEFSGSREFLELTGKDEGQLAFGYATLVCDQPVAALNLLAVGTADNVTGMAARTGARPADRFQFMALPAETGLAMVLANVSASGASCVFELESHDGVASVRTSKEIGARSTSVWFLRDLFVIPDGFPGGVARVSCDAEVAAESLPLAGGVFTSLPAVLLSSSAPPDNTPAVAPGCSDGTFIDASDYSDELASDCRALVAFANALIGSGLVGEDSPIRQWGSGDQTKITTWEGISISSGRVVEVFLRDRGLAGEIPAEIALLSELRELHLSYNDLSGAIPRELGNLANLESLELAGNRLSGTIPSELGLLTNLTSLWLQNNELRGKIPSELGNLIGIRLVYLNGNELSGEIPPELGKLTNLWYLWMHGNEFVGAIPEALLYICDDADNECRFDARQLHASIDSDADGVVDTASDTAPVFSPESVPAEQTYTVGESIAALLLPEADGGNPPLTYEIKYLTPPGLSFDSGARWLSGAPVRAGFYEVTYVVRDSDGDSAELKFTIRVKEANPLGLLIDAGGCTDGTFIEPGDSNDGLAADCGALVAFANALIGTGLVGEDSPIRTWGSGDQTKITTWEGISVSDGRVVKVFLRGSGLAGEIPTEITLLSELRELELSNNDLSGVIPRELGNLANLETLGLAGNRLSGNIPTELGLLTNLFALWLQNNELSGEIPAEFGNLTGIGFVYLFGNKLSGEIPREMGKLTNLLHLWMNDNDFVGAIPEALLNICDDAGNECRFDVRLLQSSIDSDADGVANFHDAFPNDPSRSRDTDGDGISDDNDPSPNESAIGELRIFKDTLVTMPVEEHLTRESLELEAYSERFYSHFEDAFDFLMLISNVEDISDNKVTSYAGVAYPVSNDISGIGLDNFYHNSFGSAGKLKRLLHFPGLYGIEQGPGLHEVMHAWANYVVTTSIGGRNSHWRFSSVNGQLGGFDPADLTHLGDNRYSAGWFGLIANGGNGLPYSDLELYLAGFIPAREVAEIQYFEDGEWSTGADGHIAVDDNGNRIFTGTLQTVKIENLIERHGERVPSWTESQKEFRTATVLVYNRDDPPTYEQMQAVSEQVEFFSNSGPDSSHLYNFHEATQGKGSMLMDGLSNFVLRRPGFSTSASRALPPSYGHPPHPEHSHPP